MDPYIPDKSGINSLGGFAYQIKVFVNYLISLEKGMNISFEALDDISLSKLRNDNIDINEDNFRSILKRNNDITAIQVKRTTVNISVAKKTLLNWILLEKSSEEVLEYVLFTDSEYNNEDIMFEISARNLFDEVEATTKSKKSTIGKVKDIFFNRWADFEYTYNLVKKKYRFISLTNIDELIDNKCEILFKKAAITKVTYYRRIQELMKHITFEIMEAVNNKKSYTIKFEDMIAYSEDICNRFTNEIILPQYSEFKKIYRIDLDDPVISNSREYKQLVACRLPKQLIEQHLNYKNYYKNVYYYYMELNKIGIIQDIDETNHENFENVKFKLQIDNRDTPYNRLDQTKNSNNSYANNDQIKYGSIIHLTRENEVENQISWEDEENE
ncbi:hypothetical protein ACRTAK_001314 [Clostridium perfringens]